ncbi:MAG: NnrU family protein, partial [Flavobacteriaceae bacterium]
ILSVSHLIPEVSIDQEPKVPLLLGLLNNLVLIALFGIQHSVMARPWFKDYFSNYFPKALGRSTFTLVSGLLLFFLVIQWQPMGGLLWDVSSNRMAYHIMYALFFIGWSILFISTFLINHFDLFGLRQVYCEVFKKSYKPLNFKVIGLYKYVRHPLYFGGMLGLWATPVMTITHLVFAIGLSAYFIIGTVFEENDLRKEFGDSYKHYTSITPKYIPFTKRKKA